MFVARETTLLKENKVSKDQTTLLIGMSASVCGFIACLALGNPYFASVNVIPFVISLSMFMRNRKEQK